jgi:hypothetical protein
MGDSLRLLLITQRLWKAVGFGLFRYGSPSPMALPSSAEAYHWACTERIHHA